MGQLSRRATAQKSPQPGQDLSGFTAVSNERKFRAVQAGRGPWWFSSDLGGRFDLVRPRGTCYFADDVNTAVRERLAHFATGGKAITAARAEKMEVAVIGIPKGKKFANVVDERADKNGVIRELCTMINYRVPQAWAAAFADGGFDGIRYTSRYTSVDRANSWALFGTAGVDATLEHFPAELLDGPTACEIAEVPVRPRAGKLKSMTVISPPGV